MDIEALIVLCTMLISKTPQNNTWSSPYSFSACDLVVLLALISLSGMILLKSIAYKVEITRGREKGSDAENS